MARATTRMTMRPQSVYTGTIRITPMLARLMATTDLAGLSAAYLSGLGLGSTASTGTRIGVAMGTGAAMVTGEVTVTGAAIAVGAAAVTGAVMEHSTAAEADLMLAEAALAAVMEDLVAAAFTVVAAASTAVVGAASTAVVGAASMAAEVMAEATDN